MDRKYVITDSYNMNRVPYYQNNGRIRTFNKEYEQEVATVFQ